MHAETKPKLLVAPCDYKAAKYAVEHWHYSKSMPTPPIVPYGVWEDDKFIGAVMFSCGANNNLGLPYGLRTTEVCELTRVALSNHKTPVSRIVSLCIKMLSKSAPTIRLIVSFADENEGHHGGIYQAMNWVHSGRVNAPYKFKTKEGRILHQRQVSVSGIKPQYGEMRIVPKIEDCEKLPQLDKYRYLYPLDKAMREQIAPLAKPYPKREHANG